MSKKEVSVDMVTSVHHAMSNQDNPNLAHNNSLPSSPVVDANTPTSKLSASFGIGDSAKLVVKSLSLNSNELTNALGLGVKVGSADNKRAIEQIVRSNVETNKVRALNNGAVPKSFKANRIDENEAAKNAIGDDGITPKGMGRFRANNP